MGALHIGAQVTEGGSEAVKLGADCRCLCELNVDRAQHTAAGVAYGCQRCFRGCRQVDGSGDSRCDKAAQGCGQPWRCTCDRSGHDLCRVRLHDHGCKRGGARSVQEGKSSLEDGVQLPQARERRNEARQQLLACAPDTT